jgi:hypothetical protein
MKTWVPIASFVVAAAAAAFAPLLHHAGDLTIADADAFPGWPTHYEGRALTEMALTPREVEFVRDFPGRVGRFSDGRREIIVRWVGTPTRRLHSAADCFRGIGYGVTPMPVRKDAAGQAMGCFRASHRGDDMMVCEVIRDERSESWPDVSAWYWNAMLGSTRAPWWSFVVAERE